MSLEKIQLRKFLELVCSPANKQISLLRADIRSDIRREKKKLLGEKNEGGHFHLSFWSDAKDHVTGQSDLHEQTVLRINANPRRKRLYPQLRDGFLKWWNEKRRWRNQKFELIPKNVKGKFSVAQLKTVVVTDNILALKIGDESCKIIYPYFAEDPPLSEEGARLGLWLMSQALPAYQSTDMRIIDILRGNTFALRDYPLQGNEEDIFIKKYAHFMKKWKDLRKEY